MKPVEPERGKARLRTGEAAEGGTCTLRQTEKLLGRLSLFTLFGGLATASLFLFFCSFFFPRTLFALPPVYGAGTVLFLLACLACGHALEKNGRSPLTLSRQAAAYWEASRTFARLFWLFPMLLTVAGLAICFADLTDVEIGFPLAGLGIGLLAGRLLRRYGFSLFLVTANEEEDADFSLARERRRTACFWSLWWAGVLAIYGAATWYLKSPIFFLPFLVLAAAYFVLRLVVNNPFRRYASLQKRRVTVRILNLLALLSVVAATVALLHYGSAYDEYYIYHLDYSKFSHNSEVSYDSESGVFTVRATTDELRILQLSDIHLCDSITTALTDRKALRACYETIWQAKPDLIVVTGDLVYPVPVQTFGRNNSAPFYLFCRFMNLVGIPWAITWGNHDTEVYATEGIETLEGLVRSFRQEPDCPLLYADKEPDVFGRYNQYLRLENADGSLNRLLYLIDSNDYVEGSTTLNEYDAVHPDQIAWYRESLAETIAAEGRRVPSFLFLHIPLPAFRDAAEALAAGQSEAVYLFGENREGKVSCSELDYGLFEAVLEAGSTEAIFCGHDHLNGLAVTYRGVDLVYGRSIDYVAYPGIADITGQRGGILIVCTPDGGYTLEEIVYPD